MALTCALSPGLSPSTTQTLGASLLGMERMSERISSGSLFSGMDWSISLRAFWRIPGAVQTTALMFGAALSDL
jgi:hypothetical protein